MGKKKLAEMTPIERMNKLMKGLSWEEAEDVGVEILARCIALHTFAREDIDEYLPKVFHRIRVRACEWASHEGRFPLAMAKSAVRHQKEMEEIEKSEERRVRNEKA